MRNPPVEITFVITGGEKNGKDLACADFLQSLFENKKVDQTQLIQRVYGSEDAERHLDPCPPEFPFTDLDYCTWINAFPFSMPVFLEDGLYKMRPFFEG